MSIVEILLPVALFFGVPYVRKAVVECLKDDSFETHIFLGLRFNRKSPQEQSILIENVTHAIFVAVYALLLMIVPFQNFVYYTFQELYVALQICMLCAYSNQSTRTEKAIVVVAGIVYVLVDSAALDMFVLYTMVPGPQFLVVEKQIFGGRMISETTRRIVRLVDSVLLGLVWCLALVSFYATPNAVDVIAIPCLCWMQYLLKSQNKKQI